ncbi:7TM diverse intracellular signaling domain-containing protein [Marinobacter sp. SS5-14b]|uniref:7TM diverse intracellular signaling domain-containing protein n=1 Tax=Marinobacter sp. SS5-14b TaxID=3050456 RepID=UPI0026DEBD30|nr:7TM diverse intracellular signaling domain-containing protein [Marinobacter sp. SS5-14b]
MIRGVIPLIVLLVLIGLVMAVNAVFLQPPVKAVEGSLDLRDWSTEHRSRVMLSGDWAFYPNQFLTPDELAAAGVDSAPLWLSLPGVWSDVHLDGRPLPANGYASLALHLKLPERGRFVLKVPTLTNSYRLWIDGEPMVRNPAIESLRPDRRQQSSTRYIRFTAETRDVLILFHVSNYQHRVGGIWEPLYLAPADNLFALKTRPMLIDILIASALTLSGIVILFLAYQRNNQALFFLALIALLMALRCVTIEERILFQVFRIYDWQWQQRIEHLILYAFLPFMGLYLWRKAPFTFPAWLAQATASVVVCLMLIVLLTDAAVFSHTLLVFHLFGMVYMFLALGLALDRVMEKKRGGKQFLGGALLLILASLNDIFYANTLIESTDMLHIGALGFILFQLALPRDLSSQQPIVRIDRPRATGVGKGFCNPYLELEQADLIASALRDALIIWETRTGKDKVELAEASGQWRITNDCGSLKTRTLDKYLRAATVPARPRIANVLRTLQFVMTLPELSGDEQQLLEAGIETIRDTNELDN